MKVGQSINTEADSPWVAGLETAMGLGEPFVINISDIPPSFFPHDDSLSDALIQTHVHICQKTPDI